MINTEFITIPEKSVGEINWEILEATDRRKINRKLSDKYGSKVFCHEAYAEELCKLYVNMEVGNKELAEGAILKIVDIISVTPREMTILLEGYANAVVRLDSEKKFFAMLGINQETFVRSICDEDWKRSFLEQEYHVRVEGVKSYNRASLYAGQTEKVRKEFFAQIDSPDAAYYGTITGKNHGGFIINVQGVEGFLPGSLAAANVVRNFDEMIGKKLPVMVEDYLQESSTFVFSYKRYLSHILPQKIEELDRDKKYRGVVTGSAKYGIFVEFEEIFTGLIHTSKMTPELRELFKESRIKPGKEMEFWIKEINNDKKIILTDEDPSIRQKEIADFGESNMGTVRGGEVISVQPFGTLVRLQKDIVGLISQKEIKSKKKKFNVGDTVMVTIDRVQNDKIYLTLPGN